MHIDIFFSLFPFRCRYNRLLFFIFCKAQIFFHQSKHLLNIPLRIHRSSFWISFPCIWWVYFLLFFSQRSCIFLNLCPNHFNLAFSHAACRTCLFLVLFIVFTLIAKRNIFISANSSFASCLFVCGIFLIHRQLVVGSSSCLFYSLLWQILFYYVLLPYLCCTYSKQLRFFLNTSPLD